MPNNNAFTRYLGTPVPQGERADDRQVKNNAGGFTFTVDDKTRLERFLILGTDGGTYYADEKDLTKQNLDFLKVLIKSNEVLYWDTVRDVSVNGRSFRNSAAILATAYLFQYGAIKDTPQERFEKTAFNLGMEVIRTFTHMAELVTYFELLGGWNRQKRRFIDAWYKAKGVDGAAYQAVKYRQRGGWTHRDLFRLAHPEGVDVNVGNFILGKFEDTDESPAILQGFQAMQQASGKTNVLSVLDRYTNLPWEAIPTQFLKEPDVWKKLFYNGQLKGQALVRNITRLARISAFNDMVFASDYAAKLTDEQMIARTRLHPINYLNALVVHTDGQVWRAKSFLDRIPSNATNTHGIIRVKNWDSVSVIVDALNEGFHLAFKAVEPAGKRTMLGLDISGSMSWSAGSGLDLTCSQVSAAMSMAVARTEPYYMIRGFSHAFKELGISPGMNLSETMAKVEDQTFGRTDCALPMVWAKNNNVEIDTFVIYTDNETWFGSIHPHVALRNYREKTGIDAKLVVAGITATDFTIADPSDRGMMDVCGFDSNAPKVLTDFSAGRI